MGSTLRLIPADDIDVCSWSFGRVESVASLYDPKIFGPTQDESCECGKYSGPEHDGIICDRCFVKIANDSSQLRHTRLGQLKLHRRCPHPLDPSHNLEVFPIAPIAFRTNDAGQVNPLGTKYEQLVTCCLDLHAKLPPHEYTPTYYRALFALDISELQQLMAQIIGCTDSPDEHSLLPLIFKSIRTLDPSLHTLLHSCALMCDITTAI
jgi:hypothetical protein